ncbi:sulfotransferase [Anabaena sp. PCC 7108]|uniref:sulfotransferase n=1 Tax=Anabaena sp. PCC 7108 TaxID=163908 RepID=UPI0003499EC4|nr:sulfotransferase [Anabaena sp. PCC 7108]
MHDLLIILSPPRSFSSVVSSVIGEHPQLYCFPELHLFVGDTVQEVIDLEYKKAKRYAGSPGVLRTLAQLHDGIQTTGSIVRAIAWLNERRDWTTKQLLDYLLEGVKPKIGVEKSPPTSAKPGYIERAYAFYPQAYFLHLTRHPVSARKSMQEFSQDRRARLDNQNESRIETLIGWYQIHCNIINFTNSLPAGQTMRIKGEDVLSEPDVYLPQISEWMGLRTDKEAIEAMKHPENSPYAYVGPYPARGGNDPKFMQSPSLRSGRVKEPSLEAFFKKEKLDWFSDEFKKILEESELQLASDEEIIEEITRLANLMGYH